MCQCKKKDESSCLDDENQRLTTTTHSLTHAHYFLLASTTTNEQRTNDGNIYRPEALGIVPGAVFLVCLIFCLVGYASTTSKLLEINAALLSVCFMLFLGFTDDVLDWPWRYKRTWTLASVGRLLLT
jgi:UDP-N-acetylmuramyl pentapeptide phosphotransferase/UDP-N-acetylglucosamine-1-phosphate transferase